jgi:hypothetical protein
VLFITIDIKKMESHELELQTGATENKLDLAEFIERNKQMIMPSSEFFRQDLSAKLTPNMAYFNFQEYRDHIGVEGHLVFIGNDGNVYKAVIQPDKIDNFPMADVKVRMKAAYGAPKDHEGFRDSVIRGINFDMEKELHKLGFNIKDCRELINNVFDEVQLYQMDPKMKEAALERRRRGY